MDATRSFEWDEAKSAANLAKHGISFAEATAAFSDADRLDFDVTDPSRASRAVSSSG